MGHIWRSPLRLVAAGLLSGAAVSTAAGQGIDYVGGSIGLWYSQAVDDGSTDFWGLSLRGLLDGTLTDELTFSADVTAWARRYFPRDRLSFGDGSFADTEVEADTFALTWQGSGFDVTAGSQIVALGQTDGFVLLDRMNGRDMCEFSRLEIDNKDPGRLVEARAFSGDHSFRLIVGESGTNDYAEPRSYCEDTFIRPNSASALDDPADDFDFGDDWAGAVEYKFVRDTFEFSLDVVSVREADFVLSTYPSFGKLRPRTTWFGGSASATLGSGVIRGEVAYAPDRAVTLDTAETMKLAIAGAFTDGTEKRANTLVSIGYEFDIFGWTVDQQLFLDHVERGRDLVREQDQFFSSMRLRKTLFNDKIDFQLFLVADLKVSDIAVRTVGEYQINDSLRLNLGGVFYSDHGSDTGFFGSFDGRSVAFVGIELEL